VKDRDPEKAANFVKEMVQRIKAATSPLELAINTQMTRNLGGNVTRPSRRRGEEGDEGGHGIQAGDIITYIVTKGAAAETSETGVSLTTRERKGLRRGLLHQQPSPSRVMRILEALGYQEEEMKKVRESRRLLGGW